MVDLSTIAMPYTSTRLPDSTGMSPGLGEIRWGKISLL